MLFLENLVYFDIIRCAGNDPANEEDWIWRIGTENLRRQLKGYLDEANKAKSELSECKRELFKLQQQKK